MFVSVRTEFGDESKFDLKYQKPIIKLSACHCGIQFTGPARWWIWTMMTLVVSSYSTPNKANKGGLARTPGSSDRKRATTSGRTSRLSLIWPATYSFNIILALSYIVLGMGPNCKPAPVPWLLSKKRFLQSLDCVAWFLRNSASSFDPPVSECVSSMVQRLPMNLVNALQNLSNSWRQKEKQPVKLSKLQKHDMILLVSYW
jgi:hypothetical protein